MRVCERVPGMVGVGLIAALLLNGCESSFDAAAPGSMGAESEAAADSYAPRAALRPEESESEDPFADLKVVNDEAFDAMYFEHYGVNPTIDTSEEHFSTFSVDVDQASYAVARAYLQGGNLPPEAAVRVEEFVNSMDYHYPSPDEGPFDLQAEAVPSPSRPGYHLLHLGLQGRRLEEGERRPTQLVFVIDVSGSMNRDNRLGLVQRSLRILVDHLRPQDRVGIVVYGSRGREVLDSTPVAQRERIMEAIDSLTSEGSTNAQEGLELGYAMAARHLLKGGINRIVLCSDGVANNGITTSAEGIFQTVRDEVDQGVTISTVGFGMGNYNDVLMERLAQHGHGNYHYVDTLRAAQEIFAERLDSTLEVIAKDVKIQVEFDPERVSRFRLLGYENRRLETEDFEDDFVPAGYVGPGHSVTALYEVKLVPGGEQFGTVRVRYKRPDEDTSQLIERALPFSVVRDSFEAGSAPLRTSAVAALFAEKLRGSYWVRRVSWDSVVQLWEGLPSKLRELEDIAELGDLVRTARRLDERGDRFAAQLSAQDMDFDRVPVLRE